MSKPSAFRPIEIGPITLTAIPAAEAGRRRAV